MLILEGGREPSVRETEESTVLKLLTFYLLTYYTLFSLFFLFPMLLLLFEEAGLLKKSEVNLNISCYIWYNPEVFLEVWFSSFPVDRCNK